MFAACLILAASYHPVQAILLSRSVKHICGSCWLTFSSFKLENEVISINAGLAYFEFRAVSKLGYDPQYIQTYLINNLALGSKGELNVLGKYNNENGSELHNNPRSQDSLTV